MATLTPNEFEQLVQSSQVAEYIRSHEDYDPNDENHVNLMINSCATNLVQGETHSKIIIGQFCRLFIENATGAIFSAKSYDEPDRDCNYGTLTTTDEWFWGLDIVSPPIKMEDYKTQCHLKSKQGDIMKTPPTPSLATKK